MKRTSRLMKWLTVVVAAGMLPAFIMRCDKAALNLQQGLFEGLGMQLGTMAADQFSALLPDE